MRTIRSSKYHAINLHILSAIRVFSAGQTKRTPSQSRPSEVREDLEERESKRCPLHTNKEHRALKRFFHQKFAVSDETPEISVLFILLAVFSPPFVFYVAQVLYCK